MTEQEAELSLLSLANENGKFGITIGEPMTPEQFVAFERGHRLKWWTYLGIAPILSMGMRFCHVLVLTEAGLAHLASIKKLDA